MVSCVQGFPDVNGVLAGFHDGTVVLSQIKPESDAVVLRNATGVEVTAIAVTETGSRIYSLATPRASFFGSRCE